jgi:predicted ribosome quality control (RQC) complex YloA/Tae2 family protein
MINNYYTLKYITDELNQKIKGFEVSEIFTQEKNEIIIAMADEGTAYSLQICIDPARSFILLRNPIEKAKHNTVNVLNGFQEKIISRVSINSTDRIIEIYFEEFDKLVITFFRGESNIYQVNDQNKIINCFKHAKTLHGTDLVIDKRDFNITKYLHSSYELQDALRNSKEKSITRCFNKVLPVLGTSITKEIAFRASIEPTQPLYDLSNIDLNLVWQKFKEIYNELNTPQYTVYYEKNKPLEFSLIELSHLKGHDNKEFEDIFEAISTFLFSKKGERPKEKKRDEILKKIDNELLFLNSSITRIENELQVNRADEYQKYGDVLMISLNDIQPEQKELNISVPETGETLNINLDPLLTPLQNATHYFEKAKKAKEGRRIAEKRLEDSKLKLNTLKNIFDNLSGITDLKEFFNMINENKKTLEDYGITPSPEKEKELSLFRRFIVDGEFEVLCGKNSENNDLLTMKYAKPEDLWFHARGSSGSHVILKINSGKGEPGKRAIHQAAAIAAYYSGTKNSKTAPVAMTKKKYVRKPKGANPGTVTISQEKVIFVEPGLPD